MSNQAIDAAVEKILSDRDYAKEVYRNPEAALTAQFELEPGEWRSIAWSLQQDVQDSLGDVSGYALEQAAFSAVSFRYISAVPSFKGYFDRAGEATQHGAR